MAFNIEAFKSNSMIDGGARPALFEVIIPGWPGSNAISEQSFRFHCRAAQIPPSILGQVPVPYFGRNVNVIGDRTYANWNVTVMHDENYELRATMEAWHTSMNQHIQNIVSNGVNAEPSSYKRNAVVRHFSKDGSLIKTYTFVGMFPVQITNMALAWDATNQVMAFDVEFSIDYWLPGEDDGRQDITGVDDIRQIVPLVS